MPFFADKNNGDPSAPLIFRDSLQIALFERVKLFPRSPFRPSKDPEPEADSVPQSRLPLLPVLRNSPNSYVPYPALGPTCSLVFLPYSGLFFRDSFSPDVFFSFPEMFILPPFRRHVPSLFCSEGTRF